MKQFTFPYMGAVPGYGEALPGGEYAVSDGWQIQTYRRMIPFPVAGQPVHYVRIADDGVRIACGVGKHGDWRSDRVFEWNGEQWHDRGPSCGSYPAIYDTNDILVIAHDCIPPTYGQGWLFVDGLGNLVPTDDTYAGYRGVHNRIDFGDVAIGQGHDSVGEGAVLLDDDGVLRRLAYKDLAPSGQIRNILTRRDGDNFAITAVDYDRRITTITWATLDELRAMEPVPGITQPPVIVIPTPVTPKPEEPKPVSIPDLSQVLRDLNAQFPHLLRQNTADTVREFYWRGGWALHQADPRFGFLSKSDGENGHFINGQRVSVDAYAYAGVDPVVDAISSAGDGPGTGGLTWGIDPHRRESNKWVKPVPFPGAEPVALPPTVTPDPETARLRAANESLRVALDLQMDEVERLTDRLARRDEQVTILLGERDSLRTELDALKGKPHKCRCEAKIFGMRVPCKVISE